jgi:hypothetical protein
MGTGDGDMREESRAKQIRGVERSGEEWRGVEREKEFARRKTQRKRGIK